MQANAEKTVQPTEPFLLRLPLPQRMLEMWLWRGWEWQWRGDLPYCANIAASCLWQCVLLLLHSSRQARALHIFNASHKKRRAVSRRPAGQGQREKRSRELMLLPLLLLLCLGQHIFPILRLSSAHGVRQMTVEMIARRIEGV